MDCVIKCVAINDQITKCYLIPSVINHKNVSKHEINPHKHKDTHLDHINTLRRVELHPRLVRLQNTGIYKIYNPIALGYGT